MAPDRVAELRALADAATPGPWTLYDRGVGWEVSELPDVHDGTTFNRPDAEFVAAARTAIPELLDDVEQLRAQRGDAFREIERLEGQLDRVRELADDLDATDDEGWGAPAEIAGALRRALDGGGEG